MKKTAWNLLLTLPMSVFLLVLAASTKTLASELGGKNQTAGKEALSPVSINIPKSDNGTQIIAQKEPSSSIDESQLTSVSQLSDVQPSDWAFQALQFLVERYGCIAGYPNGTFKGNRALSRYEFAAGLNACLDQVNKLIASSTSDLAVKTDLETIQRLTEEFNTELAQLRGRLDSLEARTAEVEANQFSTTTTLSGQVQFVLGGVLAGNNVITKQPAPRTITFQDQARLVLNTSFTGKDQLRLTLSGGNIESLGTTRRGIFGTFDGRTADNRSPRFEPNQIILGGVRYRFPIGKKTQFNIFAQSDGANEIGLSGPTNPFEGSASNGISRFSRRNMVYNYGDTGPGIAILHNLSDQWQLGASYSAPNGDNPLPNNGLFTGRYVAFGQVTYFSPKKNFRLGLSYANTYSPPGATGQSGTNFGPAAGSNLANSTVAGAGTVGNLYGIGALYKVNPRLAVNGFVGYSAHRYLGHGDGQVWNWGTGLTFPDLGKKGSLGAIFVGRAPTLTRLSSNVDLGAGKGQADKDTSLHIEGWYQYKLTDNIEVTPGFIWVTAPDSDASNPASLVGWLRTTFRF
ncbi:carbohydrate porin [Anabaena cylindrica FACHB-243]|uniref:Carbohydrate-selective porin OprB n=1 Tax=Anabaena cylindrica (strain ATCC 27899 / PCC 7122) TaxID=272123 RepID=K9ZDI3_ANACC|nr:MULTISPECIES: iron uptake porin [Anabaena]AFZ56794.1 Carbohydrate-selective porin OprB [Anabaena cylindrica PCC 7122]MBD2418588.1 carbohydrate porin [Anabaena cylindrica FACHB-243]MBY5283600.1 iron uptake porin [Anabaena sp. CCAP 1446/1C]MBY5311300.1 iron uptake porin [Anabaena sp. CCAP 1446/1C]MCM2409334.1 iron uptake porin [Anabaena sp. CCAP 1446/1C]